MSASTADAIQVPATRRSLRAHRGAAVLALAIAVAALSSCGTHGSSAGARIPATTVESTTTTTEPPDYDPAEEATTTVAPAPTEVPTTTVAPSHDSDIVGDWTADASQVLAANTTNIGAHGVTYSGPIVLSFKANGTYGRTGMATCSGHGMSRSMELAASGGYTLDGTNLQMSTGSSVVGMGTGTATVEGNTLQISFTNAATGSVTQTYTRA